jgi:hypothetical protein
MPMDRSCPWCETHEAELSRLRAELERERDSIAVLEGLLIVLRAKLAQAEHEVGVQQHYREEEIARLDAELAQAKDVMRGKAIPCFHGIDLTKAYCQECSEGQKQMATDKPCGCATRLNRVHLCSYHEGVTDERDRCIGIIEAVPTTEDWFGDAIERTAAAVLDEAIWRIKEEKQCL